MAPSLSGEYLTSLVARKLFERATWFATTWGDQVDPVGKETLTTTWQDLWSGIPGTYGLHSQLVAFDPEVAETIQELFAQIAGNLPKLFDPNAVTDDAAKAIVGQAEKLWTCLASKNPDKDSSEFLGPHGVEAYVAFRSAVKSVALVATAASERTFRAQNAKAGQTVDTVSETFQQLKVLDAVARVAEIGGVPPDDLRLQDKDTLDGYVAYVTHGIDDGTALVAGYQDALRKFTIATDDATRKKAYDQLELVLSALSTDVDSQVAGKHTDALDGRAALAMAFAEAGRSVLGLPRKGGLGAHTGIPTDSVIKERDTAAKVAVEKYVEADPERDRDRKEATS